MACNGANTCAVGNPVDPNDPNNTLSDCGGAGVNISRSIKAQDLYIRFAPFSTAMRYLHQNDKIKVLYDNKKGWVFMEVTSTTCPALTPVGARGWIENKPEYFGP